MRKEVCEETRVLRLMSGREKNMSLDYLTKLKRYDDILTRQTSFLKHERIEHEETEETIAVRIGLDMPQALILSHPLSRLRIYKPYAIEYEWERFYVTRLGILPAYSATQNNLTVVKLWGEAAGATRETGIADILKGEDVFVELRPSKQVITYSSLNFLLKGDAQFFKLNAELDDFCRKCFACAYWPYPSKGFCASTHIIHSRNVVYDIVKAAKALCVIDSINWKTKIIEVLYNEPRGNLNVVEADILALSKNGWRKLRVYIPQDILTNLNRELDRFLNAIILEVRCGERTFKLLNVVADIGTSYYELAYTLMGKILTDEYYQNELAAYVCSTHKLKAEWEQLAQIAVKRVRLSRTLSDILPNVDELAKSYLEPLFVTHDDRIYFTNPLFVSFFLSTNKLYLLKKENRKQLLNFLRLIDKLVELRRREEVDTEIFFHEGTEPWKRDLGVRTIPRLNKIIDAVYALKLYKKIF